MEMIQNITFNEIKPFVRFAQYLKLVSNESSPLIFVGSRTAYDHRLFYISEGKGIITLNSKAYEVKKGDALLLKSGTLYDIQSASGGKLTVLCFNFDYTQQHNNLSLPVPPAKGELTTGKIIEYVNFTDFELLNSPIILSQMWRLENELLEILSEYVHFHNLNAIRISALFTSVLVQIVRQATLNNSNTQQSQKKTEKILKYIHEHYNEPLNNKLIASVFNYHPNYVSHLILSKTGLPLHKYLLRYRIHIAIGLLQSTDLSAQEIAEKVGFNDYTHFLKYFKQFTGYTTSFFR